MTTDAPATTTPTTEPNVFVGRQPILDRKQQVHGYELLFRSSLAQNFFTGVDGDQASCQTISNSLNVIGLQPLAGGRKVFINITRQILLQEIYRVLPPDQAVLELLETVEPDDEVVSACKRLKNAGYDLALDDFVLSPGYEPLLDIADYVKIDFIATPADQRAALTDRLAKRRCSLLAEKVETHEDFEQGVNLGYAHFQGYFFCKPEIVARKEIPGFKHNYLRFLQQVNAPSIDFKGLESVIRQEVSLAVKLLKYLNSSAVGLSTKVNSIHQALVLLGERPLKRWATLIAFAGLADGKPPELLTLCMVRARFCERIAAAAGLRDRELDLFMMGMLSAVDALIDRPLAELVTEMPLPRDVVSALLGEASALGNVYSLALACERANEPLISLLAGKLGVPEATAAATYRESLLWADQTVKM